jgi:hypothetical protein
MIRPVRIVEIIRISEVKVWVIAPLIDLSMRKRKWIKSAGETHSKSALFILKQTLPY